MLARVTPRSSLSLAPLAFAALIAVGCHSSTTTTPTSPSPVKCQLALTLNSGTMAAAGGSGAVTVATQAECGWTASADVGWITNLSPATGQGSGEVRFQVAANPAIASRSGQISLNGVSVRVTQSGAQCQFQIEPRSQTFAAAGGTGTVALAAGAGCAWTASSSDPWLTVTSGASGNGDGTVRFAVEPNAGVARLAALAIGDQTFVVTQQAIGAPQCAYAIQPSSLPMVPAGGTTTVAITADAGCSWTAASNASWLAVVGVGTGVGNGSVTVSASVNTGNTRTGTMTIASQTFTVTQTGSCAVSINPTSQSLGSGAGSGAAIAVTTAAGCAWTATTADSWITIAPPAGGSGNGTVSFSVASNAGPARAGTITIGGQTFTVNQAGSCAVSINPASQSLGSGAGPGAAIAVTTAASCAWTATTADSWITVTAPASGTGNGTVNFTVAANAGAARSGTITISGQTHTVNQAGSCAASINPASQSVSASGGAGAPIAVTTAAGCAWTATTAASWITLTPPASGTGNGTVNFTVAANTGAARVGTITIAGQPHTVNQAGSCAASINPASQSVGASGGAGAPIAVTTAAACAWTATTPDSWITIVAPASGTGNGTVNFNVAATTGPARAGTIAVAGQTHTVNQASGCTYALTPTSRNFNKNAVSSSSITVTTSAGCAWTAVSNDSWITVVTGASGTGNGTVTFSITRNDGTSPRVGTLTIGGQTFTVTQDNH